MKSAPLGGVTLLAKHPSPQEWTGTGYPPRLYSPWNLRQELGWQMSDVSHMHMKYIGEQVLFSKGCLTEMTSEVTYPHKESGIRLWHRWWKSHHSFTHLSEALKRGLYVWVSYPRSDWYPQCPGVNSEDKRNQELLPSLINPNVEVFSSARKSIVHRKNHMVTILALNHSVT